MNPVRLVRSCPRGVSFSEWVRAPMPTSVCTALSTAWRVSIEMMLI